jgi:hypothetical protein
MEGVEAMERWYCEKVSGGEGSVEVEVVKPK